MRWLPRACPCAPEPEPASAAAPASTSTSTSAAAVSASDAAAAASDGEDDAEANEPAALASCSTASVQPAPRRAAARYLVAASYWYARWHAPFLTSAAGTIESEVEGRWWVVSVSTISRIAFGETKADAGRGDIDRVLTRIDQPDRGAELGAAERVSAGQPRRAERFLDHDQRRAM